MEDRLVLEAHLGLEPAQAPGAAELPEHEPPGDVELVHERAGLLHEALLHERAVFEVGRRVGEDPTARALDDGGAAVAHDVQELVYGGPALWRDLSALRGSVH